jgi:type I restriction enzyme S subunit
VKSSNHWKTAGEKVPIIGKPAATVKPGYKMTEVGVIPEEWEAAAVADLVEPSAPICYGVVQVGPHTETGVPIVAIKFVKEIAHAPLHRTALHIELPYARSRPKGGDVLISIKGTIGRVGIVPSGFQGNISRELARLRIKDDSCPEYIAHQLESDDTQERIMRSVVGTTRLEFSIATLRKFPLPVPPTLHEQRAIAEALSDVDGLLGGLDRLIAKKRDLKQAAMQQLLTPPGAGQAGQTRLPGFHGEWEVKRLGDVASVSKGTQLHSSKTDEGGKYAHLNGGITPSSYTHNSNTDGSTIAISEGGNSCGFVQFMTEPYWCGGHCYSVIPNGVDNYFLYHALKGKQSAIMALRVGSGLPNVQKTGLLDFKIDLPANLTEQTAIATILSDMDAELAALEQRREKTLALKQGMMQELLTGTTRLL